MVRLALVAVPIVTLALALGLAVTSCKTENPAFCEAHPGIDGCAGEATNGGGCSGGGDCKVAGFGVCDRSLDSGTCVQCTTAEPGACGATTPACVGDKCVPCTRHDQCASRACMPDGSCADGSMVAYVRPTGSGSACTDAAPCKTINDGVKARSIVKVDGAITDNMATTIDGNAIQILADPATAKLTRMTPGPILDVRNDGADVRVYDLEITGGAGMKTDAMVMLSGGLTPKLALVRVKIDGNPGIGVAATAGTLTVSQSTIDTNDGGGISIIGASFDITNNFIFNNGGPATMLGGVFINQSNTGTRRFEFNTLTNNVAAMNTVTGVGCVITTPVVLANNIVFDNVTGSGRAQVGATNCTWNYSDIGDSGAGAHDPFPGTSNLNTDPMFVDPGNSNYHLKQTSMAKDAADPAATLTIDVDGDHRPQNGRCDMGADEAVLSP